MRYSRNYGIPSTAVVPHGCVTTAAGPTVDLGRALERVGGERALLAELVEIFLEDLPGHRQTMRAGAGDGSLSDIRRAAHTLKGSCATLGAERASFLAAALEDACRRARADAVASLLARLERELEEVQAFFATPGWDGQPGPIR